MGGPVAGVDGNWRCPACQNVNFAVREACNRCGAPRPSEDGWRASPKGSPPALVRQGAKGGKGGKPVVGENGNWLCGSCGNINFGVREACNRCGAPRPEPEAEGGAEDVLVAGVGGAWECARCGTGTVNYAERGECNMCGSPKPQATQDVDKLHQQSVENDRLLAEAEKLHARGTKRPAGGGGPPLAGVDGNWACTSCGNVNYAVRQVCNRCQAPREQSEHAPVRAPPVRVAPMMEFAPTWNGAGRGPGGGPVAGVDGNWSCDHCHNVNFAHREACNRCGALRPRSVPRGGGKGGGAPVAGVDGNWQCRYCSNVNYAVRAQCNRCGAPREEDEPLPQHRPPIHVGGGGCKSGVPHASPPQNGGSKGPPFGGKGPPVAGVDGNWKCQFCGNVNFAVREACNRCAALKADAEAPVPAKGKGQGGRGPPIAGENGNWGCPQCGNVNYASREVCNRCGAPRAEDAEDAGPAAKRARQAEEAAPNEAAWLAEGEAFEAELRAAEEAAFS